MAVFGENDKFTLIRCESESDWLRQRTLGVGGSDVAAILGVSPWKTVAQLWLEKTGQLQPEDISDRPYVAFGNLMEPLIGKWYKSKHPEMTVRRLNAVCRSIKRPWAQASLDFEARDPELGWGVLEIKTARTKRDWVEGVPDYYLAQVTHYMSVTHRPFADVAVFFRDECEYASYRVLRDEEDIKTVEDAVDSFWRDYVMTGTMPELVGTPGEMSDLARAYGTGEDFLPVKDTDDTNCGMSVIDAIALYRDASEREKSAKEDKSKAAVALASVAGTHKGISSATHRVTWVRTNKTSFDAKRLREEMPDIYEKYCKTSVANGGIRIKEL